MERRDGRQRHRELSVDPLHGAIAEDVRRRARGVFVTSGAANKANAYVGPYAASKAALETLVRTWAHETASTPLRVNLFNPGPIRTRMRAMVFPGEDPDTLDRPEQARELIVPMCTPEWHETGKFYDYRNPHAAEFSRAGLAAGLRRRHDGTMVGRATLATLRDRHNPNRSA